MQVTPNNLTVADYCHAMQRNEIRVNHEYQRSDKVWPDAARSFLIETILLGYPIPKMFLYQVTDLKSRKTIKEIVDGQQRSQALVDYFAGIYRLSRSIDLEEAKGRTYNELDDNLQAQFLNYTLSFDLIVSATPDEVRDVFRRMNLYTVPLNPEEQRHALYQGLFKWFVNHTTTIYVDAFPEMGLFSQKQLVRMQDTKLVTEIAHAFIYGIQTTSRTKLDNLYKNRDKTFTEEKDLGDRMTAALDNLVSWTELYKTSLMKPHQLYALVLALMHVQNPIPTLEVTFASPGIARFERQACVRNLSTLAEALDNPEENDTYESFIEASAERTNVASQRATRFTWFCRALSEELI